MKKVERTAVRCPAQRPAWTDAARCDVLCSALLFQRHLFGRSAWAGSGKVFERAACLLPLPWRNPSSAALRPFQYFWWGSPSILSSRFFLLEKAAQASSSSVSSFRVKQSRHPLLSFLPSEKSCQTPPRPPLSPLEKAAWRSFFLFLPLKVTMCIRLHAPRRWA